MIFISYSHHDHDRASKLRARLEQDGLSCWMAPDSIRAGQNYASVIPTAIGQCSAFLLLLSDHSQRSLWVPKELDTAFTFNRPVVPYLLDDAPLSPDFAFKLINVQQISAGGKADQGYAELRAALQQHASAENDAPAAPQPATPAPAAARPRKKSPLVWALIALLCLVLAATAGWILTRDGSGSADSDVAAELPAESSGHYVIVPTTKGDCTIVEYTDKSVTALAIPPKIAGYRVTAIGKQAFKDCKKLVSLVLPDGLTSVGVAAFNDCSALKDLSLPQSLTSISRFAFGSCYGLETFVLPDHITEFQTDAFPSAVELIVLPGSVTEHTFRNMEFRAAFMPRVAFTDTGVYTDCSLCNRYGDCNDCMGMGMQFNVDEELFSSDICPTCEGTGLCPECDGFGLI